MACRTVFALASLVALPAASAQCSGAWENCSSTMCCSTPFFQCVEKNAAKKHNGEFVPPYAQCRNSNHTSSCPCKNPPCFDYANDYKLKVKLPWSCVVLTGGCSPAFKECGPGHGMTADEKKNWKGTPCCQYGCTCNYTIKWAAQCQPPEGMYACTKHAQKKVQAADKHGSILFDKEELSQAPRTRFVPWLAAGAGVILLVSGSAMVMRKRRNQGATFDDALVDSEADVDSN